MKKYRLLVRGENFLINLDDEDQRVGFYTTVFVEAKTEEEAELKAIELLRNDRKLLDGVRNPQSDSPMMFVDEIDELDSFKGLNLPRTGFAFFPQEED